MTGCLQLNDYHNTFLNARKRHNSNRVNYITVDKRFTVCNHTEVTTNYALDSQ